MPFDSTPQVEVVPDVCSVAALAVWLSKQDPATAYSFLNSGTCLLTQYFAAHGGVLIRELGRIGYEVAGKDVGSTHPVFRVAGVQPWTYGAALARALSLSQP